MAFDGTKPAGPVATTESVRDNFNYLKGEVDTLKGVAHPTPSSAAPTMDTGTVGAPGSSANWSRGDHVHPSDTSRVPIAGGVTMTGLLILSGPPTANNGAATKQYVDSAAGTGGGGSAKALLLAASPAHAATGGYPPMPGGTADNGTLLVDADTISLMVWYDSAWVPVQV